MPTDIGVAAQLRVGSGEEFPATELLVLTPKVSHQRDEPLQPRGIAPGIAITRPVEPVPFLVMAVGVVIAELGAIELITHREHRHSET